MGAQQWFVSGDSGDSGDSGEQGPLSSKDLREWVRVGRLVWSTRLRLEGSDRVIYGRDIAGLLPPEPVALPEITFAAPAIESLTDKPLETQAATPRQQSLELPEVMGTSSIDPGAKPEELFENYAANTGGSSSATRRSALVQTRAIPAPIAPRLGEPGTRGHPRPATAAITRTVGARILEPTLEQPNWMNLWPLVTLCLILGWIVGGFFSYERLYGPDDSFPVFILAIGGVPMACAAMLHYLRPRQVPIGTAIGVALFTAIAGIIMLLILQGLAAFAAHSRVGGARSGGVIFLVFKIIGLLYEQIYSEHVVQRWIGFVFGVGLCEEMTKLLPLAALVVWRADRHLSVHAFLFVGFASGLGFGIGEAFYGYAPWNGNHGLGDNIIRWYSCVPSHAIYTTVCAAFLWKLGSHLEYADGFWGRTGVVAMAAGLMAVVHGTYNTVCSLGVVASLFMEVLSFVLLVWAVAWVTHDAREPQGTTATPWLPRLFLKRNLALGLGLAAVLLLGAGALSSSRAAVLPDILRNALPKEYHPYVAGVTITKDSAGNTWDVPLQVRFVFEEEKGLVGYIRNQGDTLLRRVSLSCRSVDGNEQDTFEIGDLAAGEEQRIDAKMTWEFTPGEALTIIMDRETVATLVLP